MSETLNPGIIDAFTPLGYKPSPKQKLFHSMSSDKVSAILFGGARGGGKAQVRGTLLPTPSGWKAIEDIHPGSHIFGRDGKVYNVTAETPWMSLDGYRLTFDDGSDIVVNDDHLWLTLDAKERSAALRRTPEFRAKRRASRPSRAVANPQKGLHQASVTAQNNSERKYEYLDSPTGTVRTTAEIVATLETDYGKRSGRGDKNHAVPVCEPLNLPDADLPIDPYTLGAWLGDGFSATGQLCGIDYEIPEQFRSAGYSIISDRQAGDGLCRQWTFDHLKADLKKSGLLGNKHVPEQYLWASFGQRLALLQGLMDTDGCANKDGSVEFTNTRRNLSDGVLFLARSLGHKANIREGRSKLNGRDCGPKWTVKFTPKVPVFRLQRKLDRIDTTNRSPVTNYRFIVSAERVYGLEMKCISVDSPDHLYLVTENFIPTHNSCALTMDAIHFAVNFPGIRILCLRRTYPELEESFLAELKKRQYAVALGAKWNQTDKKLRFLNGSEINFSYAETEVDISRILGGEYQVIYVDECTRTLPIIIKHSEENLRSANPAIPVIGWRGASNPGGIGGPYCKNRFIKPTGKGNHIAEDDSGRTVGYIQSLYTDNPYLNQTEYAKILNAIDDPARRAAMRDGDWDAQVGQFFEQWSYERHVIASHWDLPVEWQRYCGIDYGVHAPWAVVWAAIDNDGRMWVYRELYATGVPAQEQAMQILEAEEEADETEVIRTADPSMWGNNGTPMSIADIYGSNGCGIMQADNKRLQGWARCHHFLNESTPCVYHAEKGWKTCPMLHVFGDECPNFVETIPELPRDPNNPDDAATKNVPDHIPDAWRYMCMTAGTAGGPVIYENTSKASHEGIRQPHEEENASYLPAQPLIGGRFVVGNLGMRI